MTHLSRAALARYLIQTSPTGEKEGVAWHFEHCPICKEEFTVREMLDIAIEARERLTSAVRSEQDQVGHTQLEVGVPRNWRTRFLC